MPSKQYVLTVRSLHLRPASHLIETDIVILVLDYIKKYACFESVISFIAFSYEMC